MTGYLFLEIKNNRFTAPDFKVYYNAAHDLIAEENYFNRFNISTAFLLFGLSSRDLL